MDAGTSHISESWYMRLGENAVRSLAVALVLTGQMLPAGSVSAQDGPMPTIIPATAPSGVIVPAETHMLGDWKLSIRPRIIPPRPAPVPPTPRIETPAPQTRVSVPVTVNIHNQAMPSTWLWSVPSTYPTWWYAPTSAYLFQRPRPYWQLRGDFHHLQPFIPRLWY